MDATEPQNRFRNHRALLLVIVVCVFVLILGLCINEFRAPKSLAIGVIVPIESGASLNLVSSELYADHIIKSPLLFKVVVNFLHGKNSIGAGDYVFTKPENVWVVADRLIKSEQDLIPVRVTLPEGLATVQMAPILNSVLGPNSSSSFSKISQFNSAQFLSLASTSEGYLFPDTYLFLPNDTAATVISRMKNNFNIKIESIQPLVNSFIASSSKGHFNVTENDIVIMASILQKEATSTNDQRIISGILWKRLENGQLLEVDPTLVYANLLAGQNVSTATKLTDKELSSASIYNSYKYKGLPPTAIDNPGFDALTAAVTPIMTNYWFYLSDSKGVTHYSATYAEQLANQSKYLGN